VEPDLSRLRSGEIAERVGWVPQNPELGFLTHTVRDEIVHTARRLGRTVDPRAIADAFGLTHLLDASPFRLSGGEQRRLALAAGLAHRPGLVLADEPTVGQDPDTWASVVGWLTSARDAGASVAVATHDPELPRDVTLELGTAP
jgi:energy-coupling factor transport system ATP-binding protein